jgi:RNA polymerase sigma-70 factor (ECF subfamily)
MDSDQSTLERIVHDAWAAGDFDTAATLAIEGYAGEILSFLISRLRNQIDGQDAFSMFAEDLWRGLPEFRWRCSMRTWAYTLARNAANRYVSSPDRQLERNLARTRPERLSALVERVRSATQVYRRTDAKDRFRALRERLEADDQMLLILRIDRGMAWRDIAIAIAGDSELDDGAIARESARLRKSFERLKTALRQMAQEEGLLESRP